MRTSTSNNEVIATVVVFIIIISAFLFENKMNIFSSNDCHQSVASSRNKDEVAKEKIKGNKWFWRDWKAYYKSEHECSVNCYAMGLHRRCTFATS